MYPPLWAYQVDHDDGAADALVGMLQRTGTHSVTEARAAEQRRESLQTTKAELRTTAEQLRGQWSKLCEEQYNLAWWLDAEGESFEPAEDDLVVPWSELSVALVGEDGTAKTIEQLLHEVDELEKRMQQRRQQVLEEQAALTKLSFELERLRDELTEQPRDDAALLVALAAAWPRRATACNGA